MIHPLRGLQGQAPRSPRLAAVVQWFPAGIWIVWREGRETPANDGTSPGRLRALWGWTLIAAASVTLLVCVLWQGRGRVGQRWGGLPTGNPRSGAQLYQSRGCARCHLTAERPGRDAQEQTRPPGPAELVTAMWDHAAWAGEHPQGETWRAPVLSHEEMAHIFAYLFARSLAGTPGDAPRGRALFVSRGCAACHEDGSAAPVSAFGGATPAAWARAMWSHPLASDSGQEQPLFEGREMSDLFAYVQQEVDPPAAASALLEADPLRGRRLFEDASCRLCHSVKDEAGQGTLELGPERELPADALALAGSLWNHAPAMARALEERGVARPALDDAQMADLIAFLYGFRFREPGGSAPLGAVLFAGRGCASCHGSGARGGPSGPALRGRGKSFSSVSLAAGLWRHGSELYVQSRREGRPWPALVPGDVGDLITFLNTLPESN